MSKPAFELVRDAAAALAGVAGDCAGIDAERLFLAATGWTKSRLVMDAREAPDAASAARFEAFIARRQTGEPVAYIVGTQEFWGLDFTVTPATLIPRPDTETLVETALAHLPPDAARTVLDLGTGSGCILLSLLHERPRTLGTGADISDAALAVAGHNAAHLRLAGRATLVKSDWFASVAVPEGGFDAILSNPPYIGEADVVGLMKDVRDFEPYTALTSGPDGLAAYRIIASGAPARLADDGLLAVEVGEGQARDVAGLFAAAGLTDIRIRQDLAGIDRVVAAKKARNR
ncbi:peptide chain release factor N(5)-glutamine methyltransferase [Gimibacter soli]|uniref:Release factor glutamine methyltransferase n=1 Tax=Gimibacter soli TaxID=3024400 RepID=A0AAE9XPS6_9PROT|nr:peptide chain release factor N(5)-glutamine methyltransferase [Gimibacter soli]WCL54146.1 peptide chain release factor N(5)-glutamine methyltransferase [Gimibacter soli]